jgi:uncharacterized protein (TIRG00374 family)
MVQNEMSQSFVKNRVLVKLWGKYILYAAIILLIFSIIYLNKEHLSEFKKIKNISILSILYISILFIVGQVVNGYRLKIFIEVFGVKLNFIEWFGLICIQSFGNYLPFNAGILSNVTYLKVKKKVPISKYVSFFAGDTVIKLLVFGIIGTLLLLWITLTTNKVNYMLFLVLFSFIFFGVICIFLPMTKKVSNNRFINWLIKIHRGWDQIKKSRSVLVKSVITHIILLMLITMQFSIIFNELGNNINIFYIFILTIMTNVIRFISIIPGNLGLRESIAGSVTKLFGYSFSIGIMAALIGRIISMFWIFLLGIIFSFVLTGREKVLAEKK